MTSCKPSFVFHNRSIQCRGERYPSSKGIELLPFQSIMLQWAAQISCKLKTTPLQEWSRATGQRQILLHTKKFQVIQVLLLFLVLSQPAGYLKKNNHNHAGTHSSTFLFTISSLPASYPSLKSPFLCSSASNEASGQKKFQSQGKRTRLSASLLSKHGASGQHNFVGTLAHPLSQ